MVMILIRKLRVLRTDRKNELHQGATKEKCQGDEVEQVHGRGSAGRGGAFGFPRPDAAGEPEPRHVPPRF